jgi:hypothetical protein
MASYTPPSENLPIFDNSVFTTTTSSSGFTYDELLDLFLSYPVAQGEQTIASLISNTINTNLPTTAFNFLSSLTTGQLNIGTSSTGTIKIGANTGTSVHCGSIDCTGVNINNSVAPLIGNLGYGPSQTSGVMNIATGVRTTDGALNINNNASAVNTISMGAAGVTTNITGIGTIKANVFDVVSNATSTTLFGTTTTGSIDIGAAQTSGVLNIGTGVRLTTGSGGAINIGTNASASNVGPINIGSTNTPINFNNDIILTKNNYITTTASASSFTAPSGPLQVGCVVSGSSLSPTFPANDNVSSYGSIVLKAGTWVLTVNRQLNTIGGTSKVLFAFGDTLRNNVAVTAANDYLYGVGNAPVQTSGTGIGHFTSIASITAGGDVTVYFNLVPSYSTPTPGSTTANFRFVATRIA